MTPVKAACFMLQRCGAEGFFTCSEEDWEYKSAIVCVCVCLVMCQRPQVQLQRAAVFAMGKVHMPSESPAEKPFQCCFTVRLCP